MKTIIKGRCPHMCHVSRTHRVNWDWHFERVNVNSNISLKYVHTYQQIAHMSTKGSFTRDKWDEPMIVFGVVSESFHRSHMSTVAVSIPPSQAVAKRNHPFTDEASKYAGTSSKSQPDGKRVLPPASVRHQKSSPSISAEEKTQSDVKGQENRATDCISQVPPGIHKSRNQKRQIWKVTIGYKKENNKMLRRHLDATSPTIPMPRHRETDDMTNLLSPGVKLITNLVTRIEETSRKLSGNRI